MRLIAKAKTVTTPELYKEFFKIYYKEKTKALVMITMVIGIILVLLGLYAGAQQWNIFSVAILIGGGAMLIIYPRFIYKRPYNAVKNNKITTWFEFFEDRMVEINDASHDEYEYGEIKNVIETMNYFFIYHTKEKASVVDKNNFTKGTPDELRKLLQENVPYKRLKNI